MNTNTKVLSNIHRKQRFMEFRKYLSQFHISFEVSYLMRISYLYEEPLTLSNVKEKSSVTLINN